MAQEEEQEERSPIATKPIPSPKAHVVVVVPSQASSSPSSSKKINPSTLDFIQSAARKLASQPLQNSDPGVWAVLTAISDKARKRPQGMNILLTDEEHCIGRVVPDTRFRIESLSVSGRHCTINRKRVATKDVEQSSGSITSVFMKDSSTNGTFLNGEKLKKGSGVKLHHGDIVSFAAAPHHEAAFAFVYREVSNSVSSADGATLKRKADDSVSENKRLKGIGIGAPEGPISLDDVRSLQRSNKDLRKQLESHVLTIETMRNESRITAASHENELKELKESISQSYLNEIKELKQTLGVKQNEIVQITALSTERQQAIVDLTEQLSASMQSRTDADEIITSQKAIISEHERQLDEERNQRREEREKALADHKAALHKAQVEAQEELKRQSDNASKQERELKEVINKLQESDKESRLLVETLRSKLEDTRESLVLSEKKVRQLEAQVQEEQQVSLKGRKKIDTLENEVRKLRKELESEKVAREEAWAKVSALELEMEAAVRDLTVEKQRFQGARERIILRETQLRSFYSTTEEITAVFVKQQEQLKAMQRTLEDEENYENMSFDIDENAAKGKIYEAMAREKHTVTPQKNKSVRESSEASTRRIDRVQVESTSDEGSATEKHECDHGNEQGGNHTQDLECTSADRTVNGPFGSDIEGVGTVPEVEGDPIETEQVLETESPANDTTSGGRNIDLNKLAIFTGDTMQLDDEVQEQENGEIPKAPEQNNESCRPHEVVTVQEDTETTGIRTTDLLTSEVAGSWAIDTAPSVHGENDSPRSDDGVGARNSGETADALLCSSDGQAAGSQVAAGSSKMNQERQALNAMIEIVAPGFKEQFAGDASNNDRDKDVASISDSDTQGNSDDEGDDVGKSISDEDNTEAGSDIGDEDEDGDEDEPMEDERQEDSLG